MQDNYFMSYVYVPQPIIIILLGIGISSLNLLPQLLLHIGESYFSLSCFPLSFLISPFVLLIQKLTDEYMKKIDAVYKQKEKVLSISIKLRTQEKIYDIFQTGIQFLFSVLTCLGCKWKIVGVCHSVDLKLVIFIISTSGSDGLHLILFCSGYLDLAAYINPTWSFYRYDSTRK